MTTDDLQIRLAKLEERQHDLGFRLNDALYGLDAIRRDLRALNDDMRELGVAVAVRVAEDKLGRQAASERGMTMDETEKTCKTCKTQAEAAAAKRAGMSMGQLVRTFKACMLCSRHPAARTFAPIIRAQGQEPSDRWVPRDEQKREG